MKFIPLAAAALATSFALASDPAPRPVDYLVAGFEDATKDATVIDGELWTGDSDSAIVREYAETPSLQSYPAPFENAGSQFLEIDASSEVKVNPGAQGGITYIDSMVKFSAAEEDPSASITDAMFLLWLQKNGSSYDIKVKGALADLDENDISLPAKTYTITGSGVSIEPDSWHRVKVAFFPQLFGENGDAFAAFTIQIDGVDMAATEATCTQSVYDDYISGSIDDEYADLFAANEMIPASNPAAAITSIGFQGNGAIDDFVVSADAPLPTSVVLDWTSSEFSNVAYVIGDVTNSLDVTAGTATINCPKGSAITLLGTTTAGCTVAAIGDTTTPPALTTADISWYFPQTATAGQDGTAANPYEIDSVNALVALKDAVANVAAARSLCYVQTADIDMASAGAFAGIGTYAKIPTAGVPFTGTYNGQNHKISNVTRDGGDTQGIFNQVGPSGVIENLVVENMAFDSSLSGEYGCAIVGNAGGGATLRNLTAAGTFGSASKPSTHNMAGIVVRLAPGATAGAATTIDSCTNNATVYGGYTKLGGINAIVQNQTGFKDGKVVFVNCANNGTLVCKRAATDVTGNAGIVGYIAGTNVELTGCYGNGAITNADGANTDKDGALVGWTNSGTIKDNGGNSAPANVKMIGTWGGATETGFLYATVANGVATTITGSPVAGDTYLLEGNATPAIVLAAGESVAFDTALGYTLNAAEITAGAGLKAVPTTNGTVTTYTAEALATVTVTVTGGANATAVWTVNGEQVASAPATLTEGDTYSVVYTADEGYEFAEGAVTSASGTAGTENISITIADAEAVSAGGLDPAASVIEVTLDAASEEDAEAQAKAAIAVPADAAAAVTAAAYADYFEYAVVDNNDGSFTVTISGIKEAITTGVSESAVERLTDDEATAITVPAGLYYKITPSTALPISGTPVSGLSEGSVEVEKPGTSSGFYKVELSATPFDAE
ncbi:MAG: hypothetical protein IKH04_11335 [Kiritimatiellae bacterium]|nr:hypothetical protein [Kiritimatiellia bacterium]